MLIPTRCQSIDTYPTIYQVRKLSNTARVRVHNQVLACSSWALGRADATTAQVVQDVRSRVQTGNQYSEMRASMYLPILDLLTVHEAMRYIAVRDMTHPVNLFKPVTSEVGRLHNRRPVGELIICKICGHRLPGTRFCTQHLACAGCETAVATLANSERIGRKHAQRLVRMAAMEHRNDLWGCTEGSCTTLLHAAAAEILEDSTYGVLSFGHASPIVLYRINRKLQSMQRDQWSIIVVWTLQVVLDTLAATPHAQRWTRLWKDIALGCSGKQRRVLRPGKHLQFIARISQLQPQGIRVALKLNHHPPNKRLLRHCCC